MQYSKEKKQKDPETAVNKFINCWNIYAGIIFESDGSINRRNDAIQSYAEMCVYLGEKRLELADGIVVEPDYFPIFGSDCEFDYILGFSLFIFNKPVGRIRSVSFHFGQMIISAEQMTVAFNIGGFYETKATP